MLLAVVEGLMVLCLVSGIQAGKRFQDVMDFGRSSGSEGYNNHIDGWSPDTNSWDEKLYPAWKSGDARWENCWRGGKVVALLTSDSPALIGSNVTFTVTLQFPRCQKENMDGDIVYESGCGNVSSSSPDQYVYNWTKWTEFCDEGDCSFANNFPDGKPFPQSSLWRRLNFIYIFSTKGQYCQEMGRSSTVLSMNTTNFTIGTHMIEVMVYRRGYRKYYPVTKASSSYVVTDQIPIYVNLSQTNAKNSSNNIFIKDSPIKFDIRIHDPSNYLNKSELTIHWDYGDVNGSLVSDNPFSSHTYTLLGVFSVNLTIKAAIPGPCTSIITTPAPRPHLSNHSHYTMKISTDNSTELPTPETETFPLTTLMHNGSNANSTTSYTTAPYTNVAHGCFIYGYYDRNITIIDGILAVNIVQVATSRAGNSHIDFVVTCQGSIPTNVCMIVLDASCMIPQDMDCDPVPSSDQCLLTLRRAFEPGSYCVNITLTDGASLALASTLVFVDGVSTTHIVSAVLIPLAWIIFVVVMAGIAFYKKNKEYSRVLKAKDGRHGQGMAVYFSQIKDVFFKRATEQDPLLKRKAEII